jgi:hypothetical protein
VENQAMSSVMAYGALQPFDELMKNT